MNDNSELSVDGVAKLVTIAAMARVRANTVGNLAIGFLATSILGYAIENAHGLAWLTWAAASLVLGMHWAWQRLIAWAAQRKALDEWRQFKAKASAVNYWM